MLFVDDAFPLRFQAVIQADHNNIVVIIQHIVPVKIIIVRGIIIAIIATLETVETRRTIIIEGIIIQPVPIETIVVKTPGIGISFFKG